MIFFFLVAPTRGSVLPFRSIGLILLSFLIRTVGRTPWAGDQLVARPLPVHKHQKTHIHTQTLNIHALSGIRTHDHGFRASEEKAHYRSATVTGS
jgi:hypothetical protein